MAGLLDSHAIVLRCLFGTLSSEAAERKHAEERSLMHQKLSLWVSKHAALRIVPDLSGPLYIGDSGTA